MFAWIAISTGDDDAELRVLREADERRQLVDTASDARLRASRRALYSAMRRPFSEPASAVRDLLDDALDVRADVLRRDFLDDLRLRHFLASYFFGSGGNISIIFGPRVASKLRMLSCSLSGLVNTGL